MQPVSTSATTKPLYAGDWMAMEKSLAAHSFKLSPDK
jgi:hypothetical protein